jgi:hypothetical protein
VELMHAKATAKKAAEHLLNIGRFGSNLSYDLIEPLCK